MPAWYALDTGQLRGQLRRAENDTRLLKLLAATTGLSILSVLLTCLFSMLRGSPEDQTEKLISQAEHAALVGGKLDSGGKYPQGVWWEHTALKPWQGCVSSPVRISKAVKAPRGYLKLSAQGGVNQQRQQICDTVALARHLGARLVVPDLAYSEAWHDNTTFKKIFDQEYFIEALKKDVLVVEESKIQKRNKVGLIEVSPPQDGKLEWFETNLRPLLQDDYMVRLVTMVDRLEFDNIPDSFQRLRCRACFHALQWADPIVNAGAMLLDRMQDEADLHTNSLKFVSVHLRIEADMRKHSGCQGVNTTTPKPPDSWSVRVGLSSKPLDSPEERRHKSGHCPLTLEEVALFLQGLGYPSATPLYIAGGELPSGDALLPLARVYPNLYSKDRLLLPKELGKFTGSMLSMAALDYIMCLHSTVFVSTHGSNMADFVTGERMYFSRGLSIMPHKTSLVKALKRYDSRLDLAGLIHDIRKRHSDAHLLPTRKKNSTRTDSSVYRTPLPDCMCLRTREKPLESRRLLRLRM